MYDFDFELDDLILEEELINEAVKDDTEEAQSYLINMMKHIIKYQYQPGRQDKSWCDSIGDSYNDYNKVIFDKKNDIKKNVINRIDLDKCYKDARNGALKETNLSHSAIPKEKPSEWDLDYITNYNNIISLLKDSYNQNATYNFKSEDDMVEFMKKKLKEK